MVRGLAVVTATGCGFLGVRAQKDVDRRVAGAVKAWRAGAEEEEEDVVRRSREDADIGLGVLVYMNLFRRVQRFGCCRRRGMQMCRAGEFGWAVSRRSVPEYRAHSAQRWTRTPLGTPTSPQLQLLTSSQSFKVPDSVGHEMGTFEAFKGIYGV